MWTTAIPWWEFIFRGAVVYVFLLILLRITGKRQIGQLAPFDLVPVAHNVFDRRLGEE